MGNLLAGLKKMIDGFRYGTTLNTGTGQETVNYPSPTPQYSPAPPQQPYTPTETATPQQQYNQPIQEQTVQPQNVSYGRSPRALTMKPTQQVVDAITKAAKTFKVPESLLYDVAAQESSFIPTSDPYTEGRGQQYADAGYPKGLFQITDPLWNSLVNSKGTFGQGLRPLLPEGATRFNPEANALTAAYLISNGQLGRWNASQGVWGPSYSQSEISPYYAQTQPDRVPTNNWKQ